MGIGGNGLRHCVRLGKIREIESEFSKIGVRMAQLWPDEVCRKFKDKNRFNNLKPDFKIEQAGPGGKIPALPMSTGLSTWVFWRDFSRLAQSILIFNFKLEFEICFYFEFF